jgi:hypothetical protein
MAGIVLIVFIVMGFTYQDELDARLNPGTLVQDLRIRRGDPTGALPSTAGATASTELRTQAQRRIQVIDKSLERLEEEISSVPELAAADLRARKAHLLLDKEDLQVILAPSLLGASKPYLVAAQPPQHPIGLPSSFDSEKNSKKAASIQIIRNAIEAHDRLLDSYPKARPQYLLDWKTHLQAQLREAETSAISPQLHLAPYLTEPRVGLREFDHLVRNPDKAVDWDDVRRDGNIYKPDGTSATTDMHRLSAADKRVRSWAPRPTPPRLQFAGTRILKQTRTALLSSALQSGIALLDSQGFDMRGWTKDISILCHDLDNSQLQAIFNKAAGWDDVELDPYDLGITCCVPDTQANKLSLLSGFLLYCHHLDKKAPWSLQDIYSFLLRLVEGGRRIRPTQFNSIVSALAPLELLTANGLFTTVKNDLARQIGNSSEKTDVKKCAPWNGRCDLRALHHNPLRKFMLCIWLLSGARFSSICQLTGADVARVCVKGHKCIALTLWFDKIFDRQGRTIVLSCNCVPGTPSDLQFCPVCLHIPPDELVAGLSLDSWFALQKSLACPFHSMRRRLAIEYARLNICRSVNTRFKLPMINVFMGWVLRSLMHREYSFDLDQHPADQFKIPLPSLGLNLELTFFVESDLSLSDKAIREVRFKVLKSTKFYRDKLKANDRLWMDFRIEIPEDTGRAPRRGPP